MGTFIWSKNRGGCHDVDKPCPTVMAAGMGDDSIGHWFLAELKGKLNVGTDQAEKPLYRVPSMAEIAVIPWNGFTVASTFSGCGGSCLGYRLAGFRVAWANEFVPAAQDSYRANKAKESYLDPRDIKLVQPGKILQQLKIRKGELDLFDGSPPCQAFSTAGKRHKGWGETKKYEGGHEQLNETLFGEWLRLLRGLMPKVFIAENVSGLVKGTCKGIFLEILAEMKAAGYRVSCKVLDAQWLGVPQQRQRTIFVGVREDLGINPVHPIPLPYRYSVRDAIPWITGGLTDDYIGPEGKKVKQTTGSAAANGSGRPVTIVQQQGAPGIGKKPVSADRPLPTVCGTQAQQFLLTDAEPGLPAPSTLSGTRRNQQDIIPDSPCPTLTHSSQGNDVLVPVGRIRAVRRAKGFRDEKWVAPTEPYTTVGCFSTSGSNVKNGAGKIEVETEGVIQRRKFTIGELRRICAFPDDFILTGSYSQQWERLGNSVPPVMMFWIARTVRDAILIPASGRPPYQGDPSDLITGIPARKSSE